MSKPYEEEPSGTAAEVARSAAKLRAEDLQLFNVGAERLLGYTAGEHTNGFDVS